jgi:hypothetical protein
MQRTLSSHHSTHRVTDASAHFVHVDVGACDLALGCVHGIAQRELHTCVVSVFSHTHVCTALTTTPGIHAVLATSFVKEVSIGRFNDVQRNIPDPNHVFAFPCHSASTYPDTLSSAWNRVGR